MAVLEDEDERAEGAGDGEQVQRHGLQRDEQRAEREEEDAERRRHDEGHDAPHPTSDRVLVVGVEGGQAAHAEPRAPQAGEGDRIGPPQLPDERGQVLRVGVLPGDDFEQRQLALRAEKRPLRDRREQRHVGEVAGALSGDLGQRLHVRHAGIFGQALRQPALRVPALALEGAGRLRELEDDPQRLHEAAASHRTQVGDGPGRLDRRRQPVAARDVGIEPRGLRRQEEQGQAGDEQDRPGPRTDAPAPGAPASAVGVPRRREQAARLDARPQPGERHRQERRRHPDGDHGDDAGRRGPPTAAR